MRRYTLISGLVFTLVACAQLFRLALRWPVRVATVDVPLWVSGIAVLIAGSLAIWAFRLSTGSGFDSRPA
jgi:hypothetical protein